MNKNLKNIPINIWDDYYEDGYVPEGKIQETYAYVEEYDHISDIEKKLVLEQVLVFLQTLKLDGVEMSVVFKEYGKDSQYGFSRWELQFKHLSHEKKDQMIEVLENSNTLSLANIPFRFYSES